jgi:hypothetical protein
MYKGYNYTTLYHRFRDWVEEGKLDFKTDHHTFPDELDRHLFHLLDTAEGAPMTPIKQRTLDALCGQHGWALYKMLLARVGNTPP